MMRVMSMLAMIVAICGLVSTTPAAPQKDDKSKDKAEANEKKWTKTATGLEMLDEKVGTGAAVKAGDTVEVHYTGTFPDGRKFDSSKDRREPLEFTVGQSLVIKGWHEGLVGMKVGGTRKLKIPSRIAYGEAGKPPVIPPKSDLHFEIELLRIK